jgi:hypothetical protein
LTDEDLRVLYEKIRTDPAFEPTFRHAVDLRQVTKITTTADALRSSGADQHLLARLATRLRRRPHGGLRPGEDVSGVF